MATETKLQGTQAVAQRIVNAENGFLDVLQERGGLTREQATKALAAFRKAKAVKQDAVGGRLSVTHGAFLERDVIRRAAGLEQNARAGQPQRYSLAQWSSKLTRAGYRRGTVTSQWRAPDGRRLSMQAAAREMVKRYAGTPENPPTSRAANPLDSKYNGKKPDYTEKTPDAVKDYFVEGGLMHIRTYNRRNTVTSWETVSTPRSMSSRTGAVARYGNAPTFPFFLVVRPNKYSDVGDCVYPIKNWDDLMLAFRGGLNANEIVAQHSNQAAAKKHAQTLIDQQYGFLKDSRQGPVARYAAVNKDFQKMVALVRSLQAAVEELENGLSRQDAARAESLARMGDFTRLLMDGTGFVKKLQAFNQHL